MHIYTYRRIVIERVVREKKDRTRKVKPVTEANEVQRQRQREEESQDVRRT